MGIHLRWRPEFYKMKADARETYLKFIRRQMGRGDAVVFVAESSNRVVGYAVAEIEKVPPVFTTSKRCSFHAICVRKGFRNRGVGSALVGAVEEWARRKGTSRISLSVDAKNEGARRLYRNLGYEAHQMTMVKEK